MAYATRQKESILATLKAANRPLSAAELFQEVQKELPEIGISTVYRTLKQYLEEDVVSAVDIPGVTPHYEMADSHHHHYFVCGDCRKLYALEGCVDGLNHLAPAGFEVTRHEIVLYGHCKPCRLPRSARRVTRQTGRRPV